MMIGESRNKVNKFGKYFGLGELRILYLSIIQSTTYLFFIKGVDDRQKNSEKDGEFLEIEINRIF